MIHQIQRWSSALAVLFVALAAFEAWGQEGEANKSTPAVWSGKEVPPADLDRILKEHKLWLDSQGKQGSRANLSGALLKKADLREANLKKADLMGTDLSVALLNKADLSEANLIGAYLCGANLGVADLSGALLIGAYLSEAHLMYANLSEANLVGANLIGALLIGASLREVNLRGANLMYAHLSGTSLLDADLTGANLSKAYLSGTFYELKSGPELRGIAEARDLEFLTYGTNPDALFQLRKQFQDSGFRTQERKITYALNRREAEGDGLVERWFRRIAFEWTCQYGMNPGQALKIWGGLFSLCWLAYVIFIHLPGESGVYRIKKGERQEWLEEEIRPRQVFARSWWRYSLQVIAREPRLVLWAGFFSLMSAFNIGFREIDFGRWLRLLPRTEFDLKAKGWARTVAGFQSLFSVYLIALWVLTYFGRPFD